MKMTPLPYHVVHFHADGGNKCAEGRRTFTSKPVADQFAELMRVEPGHTCKDAVWQESTAHSMGDFGKLNAWQEAAVAKLDVKRQPAMRKTMKCLPDNRPKDWKGEPFVVDICPDNLWPLLLVGKLHEEAEEIREDMTNPNEYADAVQILMSLAEANGVQWGDVLRCLAEHEIDKGPFTEGKVMRREPETVQSSPVTRDPATCDHAYVEGFTSDAGRRGLRCMFCKTPMWEFPEKPYVMPKKDDPGYREGWTEADYKLCDKTGGYQ